METTEILKKYCKQKYGNEIVIKTYDIQEIKQIIDFTKQLLLHDVINWLVFDENNEPEDEVKDYLTLDSNGNVQITEWYEGDYFQSCSGGHWRDDEGYEISNIIYYAEIPKPTCLQHCYKPK